MKRTCKTCSHQRGFTMIEMVIVLIVMAIVATFILVRATPGSNDLIAQAEILKSHLRYAQIRAMNDTVPWGIRIPNSGSYILYKSNDPATSTLLPGENGQAHTLPTNVTITAGTDVTYYFNSWGAPVDAVGTAWTAAKTITVKQGSELTDITITKNTGYIP
jgi:prepilin-type N-terminal cleavage/methylation domain-containing protein